MTGHSVEQARRRALWHRLRLLLRVTTAAGAMVLFVTVGLFGQLAGLNLPLRMGTVSIAVIIALVARLERASPPMPGVTVRRATPLRRSAMWISWFTLVFLLALRIPPVLVTAAALLPVLGVFLNTSRHCLTPAARRTALFAPLLGHIGLIAGVLGGFGHAPWWVAGLGLWLSALVFIVRMTLPWWLAMHSRDGHHERVLSWLYGWTGGLVDHATQCHTLVLAGKVDAARSLQSSLQPLTAHSIADALAFIAVEAAQGNDTQAAFTWVTRQFPTQPHGPLGISDALLSDGTPGTEWAEFAQELAGTSLLSRRLLRIADANVARSFALLDDPRAHGVITQMLDADGDWTRALGPAAIHRLSVAATRCGHSHASTLRTHAQRIDPSGLIGETIRTGLLPKSVWM